MREADKIKLLDLSERLAIKLEGMENIRELIWWLLRTNLDAFRHPISQLRAYLRIGDWEEDLIRLLELPAAPPDISTVLADINKELTLANAISASRPALVISANMAGLDNPLVYTGLMAVAFATDAVDGWAARKLGTSPLGGHMDVLADHSSSALMYIYLAGEGVIPGWIPALTIGRDITTDVLRASHFLMDRSLIGTSALTPGDQTKNVLSQSRSLRIGYAGLKAAVGLTAPFSSPTTELLSEAAATICLVRGVPVIFNQENTKLLSALKRSTPKP